MHYRPGLLSLIALLLVAPHFASAQSDATAPKDSDALLVLSQAAAATGWSKLTAPADIVATGTVTRFRRDTKETLAVTLKAKGFDKSRTELQGGPTTIVNAGAGVASSFDETKWIAPHSARSMQPVAFPFLTDFVAFADADVSARYLGVETVRGQPAHKVELTRGSDGAPFVVWVSSATGLPIQIQYLRVANDNATARNPHTRYLADYRVVSGLAVPFYQEDSVNGHVVYTLQLDKVAFNVGLSDSDFTLPPAPPDGE
jgi:outer membrane lipoprotein-sorting protein